MGVGRLLRDWPAYRAQGEDPLGRGRAAMSRRTEELRPRTDTAERVVASVCPYCAVGCAQQVYVKDERVVQIEGDPGSPISRGRLCPKGAAALQLTTGPSRRHQVLYRRPYGTEWAPLDLDTAMDMIAERVIELRRDTWQWEEDGRRVARTLDIASLGGATLDNEENYLIKKLLTGLGVIQVENQARVCHSSTVAGAGLRQGMPDRVDPVRPAGRTARPRGTAGRPAACRGRDRRPALRPRSGRRGRRRRRVLPAARRTRGVRAAIRPGGHHPGPARDVEARRRGGTVVGGRYGPLLRAAGAPAQEGTTMTDQAARSDGTRARRRHRGEQLMAPGRSSAPTTAGRSSKPLLGGPRHRRILLPRRPGGGRLGARRGRPADRPHDAGPR